jgi:hypothetical protein
MHGAHVPPENNGQAVHAPEPVALFHVPVGHATHGPPSGPVNPALQVQLVSDVLVLGEVEFAGHARQVAVSVAPAVPEYVPSAHAVQAALPVVILYVPVMQVVHVPPFGPVYPMLQVQAVRSELRLDEWE